MEVGAEQLGDKVAAVLSASGFPDTNRKLKGAHMSSRGEMKISLRLMTFPGISVTLSAQQSPAGLSYGTIHSHGADA